MTRNEAVVAAHRMGMIDMLSALILSNNLVEIPQIRNAMATEEEILALQKKAHIEVAKAGGSAALIALNRRMEKMRRLLLEGNDDPVVAEAVIAQFGEGP